MISFDKAAEIMMKAARPLGTETVDLTGALFRILAEDVRADRDMPPFDKSAMDGYACRREDLRNNLQVVEEIPAGAVPQKPIGRNECSRIMTGAQVPEGADCVIMVEDTKNPTGQTVRFVGQDTANHICHLGEDLKKGDIVLKKGTRIKPQHIAVLATVGEDRPRVALRPRVGIIATGDELVEPNLKPEPTQIRNSNSYQIFSQLKAMGALPRYHGIARDTKASLVEMIKSARGESDVLLLSGGVSMGDYDLVPGVLSENGFDILFHKVGIKPGRPTLFGVSDQAFCFGLPGNPVSTFVTFELFVKPFLFKMMGHEFKPLMASLQLGETITRAKAERRSWLPVVRTKDGRIIPMEYHGSAHLTALCGAEGLLSIPEGVKEIKQGEWIDVRQI